MTNFKGLFFLQIECFFAFFAGVRGEVEFLDLDYIVHTVCVYV